MKVGNAQFESKKVEVDVKKVDNEVKIKSEIMESAPDENIKSEPPSTFGEDDCKIIKVDGDIPGEKKSPSKEGRMGSRMSSGISSSPGGMRRTPRMNASMTDVIETLVLLQLKEYCNYYFYQSICNYLYKCLCMCINVHSVILKHLCLLCS